MRRRKPEDGGTADAGVNPAQEQTADGTNGAEEAAGDADEAEATVQEAADTTEGETGDAIIKEDENAFSGDGTVTAFIGDPFYDGVIKDYSDAYEAVVSVYDRIGADETTDLELAEVRPTEDNICYIFYQMAGDIRVYGDAVKLITDNDGKAIGLVSAILPNVKAAPIAVWEITEEEAEAIIEELLQRGRRTRSGRRYGADFDANSERVRALPLCMGRVHGEFRFEI